MMQGIATNFNKTRRDGRNNITFRVIEKFFSNNSSIVLVNTVSATLK